jgi:hypothetical protein
MNQENAFPLGDTLDDGARSIVIELEAHDASRFEWSVAIPLSAHEHLNYTFHAEFELPSVSILSPSPWGQLQGFTPLEEPQTVGASGDRENSHAVSNRTLRLSPIQRTICEKTSKSWSNLKTMPLQGSRQNLEQQS